MTLLHVIHSMDPANGGTTSAVRDLAHRCSSAGVHSEVITLDHPESPWIDASGIAIVGGGPGSTHYGWNPHFSERIAARLQRDSRVIVHGMWQHHAVAARVACAKTSVPYMVCPHGMLDPWALNHSVAKRMLKALNWEFLMRPVVRDASLISFTTEAELESAIPVICDLQTPRTVVPLGVDGPPRAKSDLRQAWRTAHPNLASQRIILFLGRLHHKKGCEILIKGFANWRRTLNSNQSKFHLRLAGPTSTPAYLELLKGLAEEEGLQPGIDVTFPGMVHGDAKWQELAAADVFILPSFQENFGIVVGEALATGLPVMVSNKVNTSSWIDDGKAGFVSEPTERGVTRMLRQWSVLAPFEREQMSRRALALHNAKFSPESATEAFLSAVGNL